MLEALLDKYADTGGLDLENPEIIRLDPLNRFGTPVQIVKAFGGIDAVRDVSFDLHAGEVLALANYPTFNPNLYREFKDIARRNRALDDLDPEALEARPLRRVVGHQPDALDAHAGQHRGGRSVDALVGVEAQFKLNDSLVVRGGGDPRLTLDKFWSMLRALRERQQRLEE